MWREHISPSVLNRRPFAFLLLSAGGPFGIIDHLHNNNILALREQFDFRFSFFDSPLSVYRAMIYDYLCKYRVKIYSNLCGRSPSLLKVFELCICILDTGVGSVLYIYTNFLPYSGYLQYDRSVILKRPDDFAKGFVLYRNWGDVTQRYVW